MGFFDNLLPLHVFLESKPFGGLMSIKWRADQILKIRTPQELEIAAAEIQEVLSSYIDAQIAEETERYISRLYENGGWELDYLSLEPQDADGYRRHPTEGDIRELLENWPSWADDKPSISSSDDIEDLGALQDIFNTDYLYAGMGAGLSVSEAEAYAILALMKLDLAAALLFVPEKKTEQGIPIYPGSCPWEPQNVIDAGNFIVEAMEIVCYAERQLSSEKLKELRAEEKEKMNTQIRADERKEISRRATAKKYASNNDARYFVKNKWREEGHEYKSKAEFARIYVRRVKIELGVTITEKQMREVWLADTPAASKPAC